MSNEQWLKCDIMAGSDCPTCLTYSVGGKGWGRQVTAEEGTIKPRIDSTEFGSITIDGQQIDHDVIIRLDGTVEKRKKKLSKSKYGTSHLISLAEAEYVYEKDAQLLIIGMGQQGLVRLDDEAQRFLAEKNCQVAALPTPEAIRAWNRAAGNPIGLFHVTC
jgi:hypothetical protein